MSYEIGQKIPAEGFYIVGIAGETLTPNDIVYIDSNGKWQKASANVVESMYLLGVNFANAVADGLTKILLLGTVADPAWSWTVGKPIYLSKTAGALTQTLPVGAKQIHLLGVPLNQTTFVFSPKQLFDVELPL